MSGLVCLPMYDWPETRGQVEGFYAELRSLVPELPATLTRPTTPEALHALWRDPSLRFGQTCWGPLHAGLEAHVAILGQPFYDDVPGGHGTGYRSAIVMRSGTPCPPPTCDGDALPLGLAALRPAIKARDSLSGHVALAEDLGAPLDIALITGSHRASIRAVAEGRADYAAIDCRSWAMARAHEPAARALTVTGWTALRPGLPFITSRQTPAALRTRLTQALAQLGAIPALEETP